MATIIKYAIRTQTGWDSMTPPQQAEYDGHFDTLSAWVAIIPSDLDAINEQWVAECYNDWPNGLSNSFRIANRVTSSENNIIITCPESERFELHANPTESSFDGFKLLVSNFSGPVIRADPQYSIIEHIGVANLAEWVSTAAIQIGDNSSARYCAVSSRSPNGTMYQQALGSATFHNNIVFSNVNESTTAAILLNTSGLAYSNIVINLNLATGIHSPADGASVYNNAILYSTEADISGVTGANSGNNASDLGIDAHESCVVTDVNVSDFVDAPNFNYRLSELSKLRGQGLNLIEEGLLESPQYDLDGNQWPDVGPWDIGVFMYQDGEPPVPSEGIKFGAEDIDAIKLGSDNVDKVMLGTDQVYP